MSQHIHSLLCLGDSYTIGEGVALYESFPYQTMQLLRKAGVHVHAPEIVAKTGWTTFELAEYLIHHQLEEAYDVVSLLIGVNNQYRGLSIESFQEDAEFLLRKVIHLAGNLSHRVAVLSIPDWGVTPFAKDKDRDAIAQQIDAFNAVLQALCDKYKVTFLDNSTASRAAANDCSLLASDGLHPAGKLYAQWAATFADWMQQQIHKH